MADLFGTFGIRGVANEDLTPEMACKLGLSLSTYLGAEGKVAVGYDPRTSSEMIENALVSGINAGGCDAVRLGMVPTPILSFGAKHLSCDAGIMITASHNPPEYNGTKFWDEKGAGFVREKESRIEDIFEEGGNFVSWDKIGTSKKVEVVSDYRAALNDRVSKIERELKVVVDCANGAGSIVYPHILTDLGCDVVSMNSHPDGRFPGRLPEPTSEHITDLTEVVKSVDADIGIAHDGDADRTIIIDENGEPLSGDRVFAIAALNYLEDVEDPRIITTVSTSSLMDDIAERLGGNVIRTKVGEPELIEAYRENGGDLAGEENGGIIYPDWLFCRDGMMTAVQFIERLAKSGKTVSELDRELPVYHQLKKKVECPNERKPKVLDDLADKFSDYNPNRTDGIRVSFDDGWFILRPSGTEPVFRCFSESKSEERAEELSDMGMDALRKSVESVN